MGYLFFVAKDLLNCFKNNRFKSIVDKCHVLFSTNRPVGIKIGGNPMDNSECKKLLGVKMDVNLHFNDHISDLLKKDIDISCSHSFCGIKQKLIIN